MYRTGRWAAAAATVLVVGIAAAAAAHGVQAVDPVVGGERLGEPGVQVTSTDGAPRLPEGLTAKSWLVADAETGDVLASYNPHLRLPPASTLKMLFADTVLPKFDRSEVHTVAHADLAGLGAGSSLVGVKENLDYRVEDLWRGVFLSSGNDAVHVLASMNGGIDETVRQMQDRATALGAADTHVVTPDGYDEDNQLSSAYDLTLFAREGLRNPDFRWYCGTRSAQFPGAMDQRTGRRGSYGIQNTDRLLGKYPGLIGVKNGYTTNAGSTYVGAAERDGRTLLVAVMHPNSYMKVYSEAAALLDWGFAAAAKVEPVGVLVSPAATAPTETASPATAADPAKPQHGGRARHAGHEARGLSPEGWTLVGLATAVLVGAGAWTLSRRRLAAAAASPPPCDDPSRPPESTAVRPP